MAYRPRRQHRYETLISLGFMRWEAGPLSVNAFSRGGQPTAMVDLIKDRLKELGMFAYRQGVIKRARPLTPREAQSLQLWKPQRNLSRAWATYLFGLYSAKGWYVKDPNEAKRFPYGFNPFARLKEIVDSIRKLPGGEYESPRKKGKLKAIDYRDMLGRTRRARGLA